MKEEIYISRKEGGYELSGTINEDGTATIFMFAQLRIGDNEETILHIPDQWIPAPTQEALQLELDTLWAKRGSIYAMHKRYEFAPAVFIQDMIQLAA